MFETRSFVMRDAKVETRESGEGDHFHGTAIVFNSDSVDLGGFVERIAPGALDRSLREVASGERVVHALWSHDASQPLGSTRSKLKLALTPDGLDVSLDTARFTPAQLDTIRDADAQMSFGFSVVKDAWEERADGVALRTVLDLELFEVSPVVWPAYEATEATLRSFEAFKETRQAPQTVEETVEEIETVESRRLELLQRAFDNIIRLKRQ